MECLEVKVLGDNVLRENAAAISKATKSIRELAERMFETMYEEDGIGLAAPQVGVSKQLIVVDTREETDRPLALLNPKVVETGVEENSFEEGCLSIPDRKSVV
jgi:peptide deformylase